MRFEQGSLTMTDSSIQAVHDDIAFLKALVLEGREGAILGGWIFVAAGVIYAVADLAAWAIAKGFTPLGPLWQSRVFLIATAIFLPAMLILRKTMRGGSGARGAGVLTRTVGSAWGSVSVGCLALLLTFSGASARLHDGGIWLGYPLCLFIFYGMAWLVTAVAARKSWMGVVAGACFATAVGAGLLINSTAVYLLFAAGLIGLVAIPGLVLIRLPAAGRRTLTRPLSEPKSQP